MKKTILAFVMLLSALCAMAQGSTDSKLTIGAVKGTVVSRIGREPIPDAVVTVLAEGQELASFKTAPDGTFRTPNLENGRYTLTFSAEGYIATLTNVLVEGFVRDLMFVTMSPIAREENDVDDSNFAEFDMDDSGYSDTPTILFGSNDVYNSAVSYGFSSIRFKNRGYNSELQDVMLSGIKLNDAITGYSPYSLWSGLNEVMRTKDATSGLETSDYAIGGFNGVTNIMGNPAAARPGLRFSVLTNSALYRLRLMATYSSGELDNGWSYVFSASARLGGNDWVKGMYYKSLAYYAGVEKNIGDTHRIALFTFATPGQRGAQNASTQEVYDLMGDNMYNSNWGYQAGKVRNARVRKTFEPITVLKYTYTPNENFEAVSTLLWRTGSNGYTALDWYDAPDPKPDYYRNLPSYAFMDDEDYGRSNVDKAAYLLETWNPDNFSYVNYQHIDWDRLYNVNYASAGGRSKYALEERHVDQNEINLAETIKWRTSDNNIINAGAFFKWNRSENYKKIADLLGGNYFLNVDSFAERDYAIDETKLQNDLDYFLAHGEAQKLGLGDKYGDDYLAQIRKAGAWMNDSFTFGNFSGNVAASVGYETFWRDGLVRKGLFPDNSKGQSKHAGFLVYSGKAGLAYVINTGHRFSVNAGYFNDAPNFNQAFLSPRTRNTMVTDLKPRRTIAADVNYQFNSMGYSLRLTGFWTKIMDQTDLMSAYDDSQNSFTNFSLTGIDQRHMGIELGVKVPLFVQGLSASGILSWGEYIYTSNPHLVQTIDNSDEIVRNEDLQYWKDHSELVDIDLSGKEYIRTVKHYVPSTPQLAVQLALNYNVNYWYLELNGQYFAHSYLDMNPLYRTADAVAGPNGYASPAEISYMASQEEFAPAFLLNASIGKSWYVNNNQIGFSFQVNNILNNRNVKTGGYEQTRLIKNSDSTRYYRFDSKYFYMQGLNYMLNIYFRF